MCTHFHGDEANKNPKIPKWPTQKNEFFKISNSQNLFAKTSEIGPWVSRIDWYEGHWCGSTYMVMRLSDIRAKTGKKCIFCVFRSFLSLCRTAPRQFYHSKIEKLTHFPQKVYRLSNPRSCDSEFRILISVQKMCPKVWNSLQLNYCKKGSFSSSINLSERI